MKTVVEELFHHPFEWRDACAYIEIRNVHDQSNAACFNTGTNVYRSNRLYNEMCMYVCRYVCNQFQQKILDERINWIL